MKKTDNNQEDRLAGMVHVQQLEMHQGEGIKPSQDDLPVLPTRNLVLFPGVTAPITLGRPSSIELMEFAENTHHPVAIVCQRDPKADCPSIDELYEYGVLADVHNVIPLPDGNKAALVTAREKIKIKGAGKNQIHPGALSCSFSSISDTLSQKDETKFELAVEQVKEMAISLVKDNGGEGSKEFVYGLENMTDLRLVINTVASNFPISIEDKIGLLSKRKITDRAVMLLGLLNHENELNKIRMEIKQRAAQNMDEQKRNVFLQSQMEAIRSELYGDEDDSVKLLEKADRICFPEAVRDTFNHEVEKLRRLNPSTPDYSVLYSYLETLLELPWNNPAELNVDFRHAEDTLEKDHYGLEKVKERILEQLAMMIHNPAGKSPIICLVGAPGVGKTSLGRSIAAALGREYQRVSLGGLHDESEIRGHRRTYIGAMPGRIIDALKRCKHSNPLLLFDEIDKIGKDYKGDPSAALLEVLDPEQNCRFHDNYVDVDYDLSNVLFIATANTLETIARPLIDRMEIIEIPGYLQEEKVEIARRHLVPRKLEDAALTADDLTITDGAIDTIIEGYTSESGVRQLEKNIASIVRKAVAKRLRDRTDAHVIIDSDDVRNYLGVAKYSRDRYQNNDMAGVVAGLAWTPVGGEILFIESSLSEGKGDRLTLTGNLGNVMKESAMIAYQYVKSHAAELGINSADFEKYQLHIHAPEGAVPKDGPSAGITIATSIVSTFKGCKIRPRVAMTGEITLRGKVLPVGGVREKILAAKRAGITDIIMSEENRKDLEEINPAYIEGLTFHYVRTVSEVIAFAVTDEKANG